MNDDETLTANDWDNLLKWNEAMAAYIFGGASPRVESWPEEEVETLVEKWLDPEEALSDDA